jgi:hypothetical protein
MKDEDISIIKVRLSDSIKIFIAKLITSLGCSLCFNNKNKL